MKSLTTQLQTVGLSLPQIETSLFVIEDWLEVRYPILAKIYRNEILRKGLSYMEGELKQPEQPDLKEPAPSLTLVPVSEPDNVSPLYKPYAWEKTTVNKIA